MSYMRYFALLCMTSSSLYGTLEPVSCLGFIGGIGWGGSYLSTRGGTAEESIASTEQLSFSKLGSSFVSSQCVNFLTSASVKNKPGLAYNLGIWAQHITLSKVSLGVSLNFGQICSDSKLNYPVGQMSYNNSPSGVAFYTTDTAVLSGKDTCYFSQLGHFGYVFGRWNPFLTLGVAEHIMRFSYLNAFGKSSGGVRNTYTMPVLGIGCNVQCTSRIAVGAQVQRHFGTTQCIRNIRSILPDSRNALGYPTLKTGSFVVLFHVIYGWTPSRRE